MIPSDQTLPDVPYEQLSEKEKDIFIRRARMQMARSGGNLGVNSPVFQSLPDGLKEQAAKSLRDALEGL